MDVFDKFFQRYSYKFPKGYPDMNDPNDVLLLENILEKLGVNLKEESQFTDFNEFINSKTIESKTKSTIISLLSEEEKILILKNASDNISDILNFLNSNKDLSKKLTPITEGKSGVSLTGPGEIAIIVCSNNTKKITSGFGDIELSNKKYELKEGKLIRAGSTYKPSIVRLTTTLWNLKQEVFEGDNAEEYKKILGIELFNDWKDLGVVKGKEGEIDFTSIGKEKLSKIRNLFTKLRDKIKSLSDEDTPKSNVITVGSKEFEVSKNELEKITNSEPGENISLMGKVILSGKSEDTLNKLRQQLKVLLSSKILTSEEYDLDDAIKREFIKDVDGLINIVGVTYTLYSPEDFINKWEFTSLKQGNRPQFALKGTQISESEYED